MNKATRILFICLTVLFACSSMTVYAVSPRYSLWFKWPSVPCRVMWECIGLSFQEIVAIQNAMGSWNAVDDMDGSDLITSVVSSGDSDNEIRYLAAPTNELASCQESLDNNGFVISMNIVLSPGDRFSFGAYPGKYDFESVIVHELGHAYGVAHCHESGTCNIGLCPNNVMSPSISTNSTRRNLTSYDIYSYQYIY